MVKGDRALAFIERTLTRQFPRLKEFLKDAPPEVVEELRIMHNEINNRLCQERNKARRDIMRGKRF